MMMMMAWRATSSIEHLICSILQAHFCHLFWNLKTCFSARGPFFWLAQNRPRLCVQANRKDEKVPPKTKKKRTFDSTLNGPPWGPLKTAMEAIVHPMVYGACWLLSILSIPWVVVILRWTRKFHQRVRRKQALSEAVYPGP